MYSYTGLVVICLASSVIAAPILYVVFTLSFINAGATLTPDTFSGRLRPVMRLLLSRTATIARITTVVPARGAMTLSRTATIARITTVVPARSALRFPRNAVPTTGAVSRILPLSSQLTRPLYVTIALNPILSRLAELD